MACDGVSHAIVSHAGILPILLTIDVGSLQYLLKAAVAKIWRHDLFIIERMTLGLRRTISNPNKSH